MSTLTRTLVLLLGTNVFWSVWAAWVIADPRDVWFWDGRIGAKNLTTNRLALLSEVPQRTRTSYSVVVFEPVPAPLKDRTFPLSFEEVAPPWIERWIATNGFHDQSEHDEQWDFQSVGWPVGILWTGWLRSVAMNTRPVPLRGIEIVEAERGWGPGYVLPIRPILAGQAFYAVFWLAIVSIVPVAGRRLRFWLGRGVNCGNDLRENTTGACPECGAEFTT